MDSREIAHHVNRLIERIDAFGLKAPRTAGVLASASALRVFPAVGLCRCAERGEVDLLRTYLEHLCHGMPYRDRPAPSRPDYERVLLADEACACRLVVPATHAVETAFASIFAVEGRADPGWTADPSDRMFWPRRALTNAVRCAAVLVDLGADQAVLLQEMDAQLVDVDDVARDVAAAVLVTRAEIAARRISVHAMRVRDHTVDGDENDETGDGMGGPRTGSDDQ